MRNDMALEIQTAGEYPGPFGRDSSGVTEHRDLFQNGLRTILF